MKNTYKYILSVILCALFHMLSAQDTDSLQIALKTAKHDTTRLRLLVTLSELSDDNNILTYATPALKLADELLNNKSYTDARLTLLRYKALALNNIGYTYYQKDIHKALRYYQLSFKCYEETGNQNAVAETLNNIGELYDKLGNTTSALDCYDRSLKINKDDKITLAKTLNDIGYIRNNQGDVAGALDYNERSLKIREEIGDKEGMASSLINIGFIYNSQGDLHKALEYYTKSLKLQEEIEDKQGTALSLNNIGSIYRAQNKVQQALKFYFSSLKLFEELDATLGILNLKNNIGTIYMQQNNTGEALNYYKQALLLAQKIKEKQNIANLNNQLAKAYLVISLQQKNPSEKQKNRTLAKEYSGKALALSLQLGFPINIKQAEQTCAQIDSAEGNYTGAYQHYKQFIIYRDSINNEGTRKASIKNQLRYEFDKKEAVIKEQQEKERLVAREKNRFQLIIIWTVIIGLILVIIFAVFIFRSLKTTRLQKLVIEEKQKEILESIRYAKRIQTSLLPTEKYIARNLKRE